MKWFCAQNIRKTYYITDSNRMLKNLNKFSMELFVDISEIWLPMPIKIHRIHLARNRCVEFLGTCVMRKSCQHVSKIVIQQVFMGFFPFIITRIYRYVEHNENLCCPQFYHCVHVSTFAVNISRAFLLGI